MIENTTITVFICDASMEYILETKNVLIGLGNYFDVSVFSSPSELMQALRDSTLEKRRAPDIIVTSVEFEGSDVDGVQLTTASKALVEGVVVICTGEHFGKHGGATNITLEAMRYGCDAWVKKDPTYTEELTPKLRHWARYVQERYKLRKMYNTVTSRTVQ